MGIEYLIQKFGTKKKETMNEEQKQAQIDAARKYITTEMNSSWQSLFKNASEQKKQEIIQEFIKSEKATYNEATKEYEHKVILSGGNKSVAA